MIPLFLKDKYKNPIAPKPPIERMNNMGKRVILIENEGLKNNGIKISGGNKNRKNISCETEKT